MSESTEIRRYTYDLYPSFIGAIKPVGFLTEISKYTYDLYSSYEWAIKPVGFLVVNPKSIAINDKKQFEAWVYLPLSIINIKSRIIKLPDRELAITPIYKAGEQQDLSKRLPIGYLYPGISFKYESITDSDQANPNERRAHLLLYFGK